MTTSLVAPASSSAHSLASSGRSSGNNGIARAVIGAADRPGATLRSVVRTKSTQRALEPLVCQINQLLEHRSDSRKSFEKACTSLSPATLLLQLDMAMRQFVDVGNTVADELQSKGDHCGCQAMLDAVQALHDRGNSLHTACSSLLAEPTVTNQRSAAAQQANGVLIAVANLLGVCDQVDVARLQRSSVELKLLLDELGRENLSPSVMDTFQDVHSAHTQLIALASHQQENLCATEDQETIAEEIRWLKQLPPVLSSSLKASVAHSVSAAATASRQASCRLVCAAVDRLASLFNEDVSSDADGRPSVPILLTPNQPTSPRGIGSHAGKLSAALTAFELQITKEPPSGQTDECTAHFASIRHRWNGISRLCDEVFDARGLASERRDTAFHLLQEVEKMLEQLLSTIASLPLVPPGGQRDIKSLSSFDDAVSSLLTSTNQLRRQLHRAAADCLLDAIGPKATSPADMLLHCALHQPQEDDILDCGQRLLSHSSALVTVSGLVVLLVEDASVLQRIKSLKLHVEQLSPQLAEAAHLVSQFPTSTCAQQALGAFHQLWSSEVRQLVDCLESGVRLRDLLAVIDQRLREDLAACGTFLHHRSEDALRTTAQHVQANMERSVSLTESYVSALHGQSGKDKLSPFMAGAAMARSSSPRKRSVDKLCEALEKLKDDSIPGYSKVVTKVLEHVHQQTSASGDHDELLKVSREVIASVKRVRHEFCSLEMRWSDIGNDTDDEEDDQPDDVSDSNISNGRAHLPEAENGRRNFVTLSTIIEETEEEFSDDELAYKRRSRSQSRRSSHVFAMPEGKSLGTAQRLVATFEKWATDHKKDVMPVVFEIIGDIEKLTAMLRKGVAGLKDGAAPDLVSSAVSLWEDTSEQCQSLLEQCQDENLYRSLVAGLARVSLLWHQLSLAVQVEDDDTDFDSAELMQLADDLLSGILECMGISGDISVKVSTPAARRHATKAPSLAHRSTFHTADRSASKAGSSLLQLFQEDLAGSAEPLLV